MMTLAEVQKIVATLAATGNQFDPAGSNLTVRLFVNSLVITPDTTEADLTEATYIGYTAVTYNTLAFIGGDSGTGEWGFFAALPPFTCTTAPALPVTVYGYYIHDSAGSGVLVKAELFATPQQIVNIGDFVQGEASVRFQPAGVL